MNSMEKLLAMKIDSVADVEPRREEQERIDPKNHYRVEAEGKVLLVTGDSVKAVSCYRNSQAPGKRVLKIAGEKVFPYLPRL